MHTHTVIVGGGASGAVLAARLSEDPEHQVLLLESGPDYAQPSQLPADLADGRRNSMRRHDWGFWHKPSARMPSMPLPRGRVVGGSSAVNTCIANRGQPEDYDEWAARGLPDWSWERCLPYFRKLERDLDHGDAPWHGDRGPLPLRRDPPERWVPFQRAFVDACRGAGFLACPDHNAPGTAGVGPHAFNRTEGHRRVSAAEAWLTAEVRQRSNLRIVPHAHVARVRWSGTRAVGVDARVGREDVVVHATRVILCAGAVLTPAILLRSGVGPAAELRRLGVAQVRDLPVGARLLDHPGMAIFLRPRVGVAKAGDPIMQTALRYRGAGSPGPADMLLQPGGNSAFRFPFVTMVTLMGHVGKPHGQGTWHLPSADPLARPVMRAHMMENDRDRRLTVDGLQLMAELASSGPLRAVSTWLWPGPRVLARRDRIDAWVRGATDSGYHPCGTVPMGAEDDPTACTDGRGAVRGTEGLHVVDASLMPTIPIANIHLPTLMIAEKLADALRYRTKIS